MSQLSPRYTLPLSTQQTNNNETLGLHDLLVWMSHYGKPQLQLLDGGWTCMIYMRTDGPGMTTTIRADFDHGDPSAAAQQCMNRMKSALGQTARRIES